MVYTKQNLNFELQIPESASLMDLHEAIQEAVDFDNDHLFEFYSGRNERNRKIVYGRDEDSWETDLDVYYEIFLEDIYPLPEKCKLYYLFDFGDSWHFEISKQRKKPIFDLKAKYPRVVASKGTKPEQYPDCEDEEY